MPETCRNHYYGSLLGNSWLSVWLEGDSDVIYTECSIFLLSRQKEKAREDYLTKLKVKLTLGKCSRDAIGELVLKKN